MSVLHARQEGIPQMGGRTVGAVRWARPQLRPGRENALTADFTPERKLQACWRAKSVQKGRCLLSILTSVQTTAVYPHHHKQTLA